MEVLEVLRRPALATLDLVPIPMAASDGSGRLLYVNRAFCRHFGTGADQLVGRFVHDELPEAERARYVAQLSRWQHGEAEIFSVVIGSAATGEAPYLVVPGPFLDETRRCFGILVALVPESVAREAIQAQLLDISALARELVLSAAAGIDGLNGTPAGHISLESLRARIPGLRALSSREWEVASRIGEGERTAAVAEALGIRPSTVRNHLKAVFKKTGTSSQAALVRRFRAWREEP